MCWSGVPRGWRDVLYSDFTARFVMSYYYIGVSAIASKRLTNVSLTHSR